jgi:pyrroloquinoline quinone biosynthesis protein D
MASRNISVSETSRPVLPWHAKLKFDETRQVWVILAPERVLAPDEIAVEVLKLCDGVRSVADMVDQCCRTSPTMAFSPKRARRRHE